jgi:hypothetical protein
MLIQDGSWTVHVAQYVGRDKDGYHWKSVPPEQFFRLDVLRRQLNEVGLPVDVVIENDRWAFRFRPGRDSLGRSALHGGRLKRFLRANYGSFKNRPVGWKWEIRQPD